MDVTHSKSHRDAQGRRSMSLTPAQLLADNVVLGCGDTARVLGLVFERGKHKGEPNRHKIIDLVTNGQLVPVDPKSTFPRWKFSCASIARYIEHGPTAPTAPLQLVVAS